MSSPLSGCTFGLGHVCHSVLKGQVGISKVALVVTSDCIG